MAKGASKDFQNLCEQLNEYLAHKTGTSNFLKPIFDRLPEESARRQKVTAFTKALNAPEIRTKLYDKDYNNAVSFFNEILDSLEGKTKPKSQIASNSRKKTGNKNIPVSRNKRELAALTPEENKIWQQIYTIFDEARVSWKNSQVSSCLSRVKSERISYTTLCKEFDKTVKYDRRRIGEDGYNQVKDLLGKIVDSIKSRAGKNSQIEELKRSPAGKNTLWKS